MGLFSWIFVKEDKTPHQEMAEIIEFPKRPRGFIDYETGRRVEIDQSTRKEYFID